MALSHQDRFNYFPASPLCCVTCVIEGELYRVSHPQDAAGPEAGEPLHRLTFSGPQAGPVASWSPGEIYTIVIAFYPAAFSQLTGIDLTTLANRWMPAEIVVPESILDPCREFFDAAQRQPAERAFSAFQGDVERIWSAIRADDAGPARWIRDWSATLVARVALSGPGKSARQIARRVKALTGLSHRELKVLGQTEQLYSNIHEANAKGEKDWGELAASSGFSDQAHMIRRLRQHTGFTPQQLNRKVPSEEALWAYRLLGEFFSRPKG